MATKTNIITAFDQTGKALADVVTKGITRARIEVAQLTYDAPSATRIIIGNDRDGSVVESWKRNNYTGEWFKRKAVA